MSQFYNPNRRSDWNYGGKRWKLSRSKIDLFLQCPQCFYIDNVLGTKRPPGFPFNLNSAVDTLFKKEFDIHRSEGTKHKIMEVYGVDAVPFQHPKMDTWRENFEGVQHMHEATGMTVSGAVDDVWVNSEEELIVVDYKSTSKDGKIDKLDADWHIGYKRQMEVYQWLLRQEGFKVGDTGYFVYANASTDEEAFDGKLIFDVTLIDYKGDDSWVEQTLQDIKACLDDDRVPKSGKDCDYCAYREVVGKKLLKKHKEQVLKTPQSKIKPSESKIAKKDTLF